MVFSAAMGVLCMLGAGPANIPELQQQQGGGGTYSPALFILYFTRAPQICCLITE